MNPAMSAWVALRRRIEFTAGQRVLVLGATGNAGRMAVQVAKHLGASHVVAAGRHPEQRAELIMLGADTFVDLDARSAAGDLAAAGADVDVVIDYLWGSPTSQAMHAIIPARADDSQNLAWVQVGSVAGRECAIPSAALRAVRLQIERQRDARLRCAVPRATNERGVCWPCVSVAVHPLDEWDRSTR